MQAGLWLREYLRELLELRRAQPADDLISGLIAVKGPVTSSLRRRLSRRATCC